MAKSSKDQQITESYQSGDLVRLRSRKGKFKLVTRIRTNSGIMGWWVFGPKG